jgi:hypothetical protein
VRQKTHNPEDEMEKRKKDNHRRAAKLAARKLHRWIGRALQKDVCPVCGSALGQRGCECGALALDYHQFEEVDNAV